MDRFQLTGGRFNAGPNNPFLTRLRALAGLHEPGLAAVGRLQGEARQVRTRTEIVREGDRTDKLHVILDGWAARVHLLPDGRRQLTRLLLPGDVADLDTLYLQAHGAAVVTLTACVVTTIKRAALRELLSHDAVVADAFGQLGASENRMLAERNACIGQRSAREHLAHLLCELVVRLGAIGQASERGLTLPITQEDVADVLGLTSVHVNRTLQSLRTDGVIERNAHAVIVRDWPALKKEAGFRSNYLRLKEEGGQEDRSFARLASLPQPFVQ